MLSLSLGFSEAFYDNIQTQGCRDGDHHAQHTFNEDRLLVKKNMPQHHPYRSGNAGDYTVPQIKLGFPLVHGF
jgi:hypothetical protein